MFSKILILLLGVTITIQSALGIAPTDKRALNAAAERAGFKRFNWVADHLRDSDRLARSSAPFYENNDSDQKLTQESIEFLKQQQITHVVSLNHKAHNNEISEPLRQAGITYTPLPVVDYGNPTSKDFLKAYKAFDKHRTGTLVWCGYGHGRTGTMISALQAFTEKEKLLPQPLTRADYDKNHVEKPGQRNTLNQLQFDLGLLPEQPPKEEILDDGEPPAKKPHLAAAEETLFGLTSWEAFDRLLDSQESIRADVIPDAELRAYLDELIVETLPLPIPPPTDICVAALSADEQALWDSLELYETLEPSGAEVQQYINDIIAEFPAQDAVATGAPCLTGAGSFGDADLLAFLNSLPVIEETEFLSVNLEATAGVEAVSEALGDEDIVALMEAAPEVLQTEPVLEAVIEEAAGSPILEAIVELATEL